MHPQMLRQSVRVRIDAQFEQFIGQLTENPCSERWLKGEEGSLQSSAVISTERSFGSRTANHQGLVLQQLYAKEGNPLIDMLLFVAFFPFEADVRWGRTQIHVNGNRLERARLVDFCRTFFPQPIIRDVHTWRVNRYMPF